MTRAYHPSRGSGLRDLFHIYLTTLPTGALMAVPIVLVWLAMEILP